MTFRFPTAPAVSIPLLGVISAGLYAWVACKQRFAGTQGDLVGFLVVFGLLFVLYGLAGLSVHHETGRMTLRWVLGFALLFRMLLLFEGLPEERPLPGLASDLSGSGVAYSPFLIYDNDLWRYLWDGHVSALGISPYAKPPNEIAERAEDGKPGYGAVLDDEIWWDVLDNMSFTNYTTVYPPLAQAFFRLAHAIAPGSVFVWKLLLILVDMVTCLALLALLRIAGRNDLTVLLYAWNPLVIKEFAGSGHVDALMICFLTLALLALLLHRQSLAMVLYAASILAKVGSAALLVVFMRRTRPRHWFVLAAVVLAASFPFLADLPSIGEGLVTYGEQWVFNPGPWQAIRTLAGAVGLPRPELWAHGVTKTLSVLVILWIPYRRDPSNEQLLDTSFTVLATVILLHSAVMPWYLLWALPLAVATGRWSWVALTALSLLSYLFYVDAVEHSWWLVLEYGVFFSLLVWEQRRRKRLPAISKKPLDLLP